MLNEKIIEKIKKLLNTANDKAATENEAMIAALKAQELMAKYDIKITDVESVDDGEEIIEARFDVGTGNKWKYRLANIVATNFCCRTYNYGRNTVVFYGYKKNSEIARDVFKFLFNIGNKFAMRYYMNRRNHGQSTVGVKNMYLIGYTDGIKSVLEKQCTALMLVVPDEVNEAYDKMTKGARTINNCLRCSTDKEAYNDGVTNGRNVAQARYIEKG